MWGGATQRSDPPMASAASVAAARAREREEAARAAMEQAQKAQAEAARLVEEAMARAAAAKQRAEEVMTAVAGTSSAAEVVGGARVVRAQPASLADRIERIQLELLLPPSLPLAAAVHYANEAMGVIGEGPLARQVEVLLEALGLDSDGERPEDPLPPEYVPPHITEVPQYALPPRPPPQPLSLSGSESRPACGDPALPTARNRRDGPRGSNTSHDSYDPDYDRYGGDRAHDRAPGELARAGGTPDKDHEQARRSACARHGDGPQGRHSPTGEYDQDFYDRHPFDRASAQGRPAYSARGNGRSLWGDEREEPPIHSQANGGPAGAPPYEAAWRRHGDLAPPPPSPPPPPVKIKMLLRPPNAPPPGAPPKPNPEAIPASAEAAAVPSAALLPRLANLPVSERSGADVPTGGAASTATNGALNSGRGAPLKASGQGASDMSTPSVPASLPAPATLSPAAMPSANPPKVTVVVPPPPTPMAAAFGEMSYEDKLAAYAAARARIMGSVEKVAKPCGGAKGDAAKPSAAESAASEDARAKAGAKAGPRPGAKAGVAAASNSGVKSQSAVKSQCAGPQGAEAICASASGSGGRGARGGVAKHTTSAKEGAAAPGATQPWPASGACGKTNSGGGSLGGNLSGGGEAPVAAPASARGERRNPGSGKSVEPRCGERCEPAAAAAAAPASGGERTEARAEAKASRPVHGTSHSQGKGRAGAALDGRRSGAATGDGVPDGHAGGGENGVPPPKSYRAGKGGDGRGGSSREGPKEAGGSGSDAKDGPGSAKDAGSGGGGGKRSQHKGGHITAQLTECGNAGHVGGGAVKSRQHRSSSSSGCGGGGSSSRVGSGGSATVRTVDTEAVAHASRMEETTRGGDRARAPRKRMPHTPTATDYIDYSNLPDTSSC